MKHGGTYRALQWDIGDHRDDHLLHHHGSEEGFEGTARTAFPSHGDLRQLLDQVFHTVVGEIQGDGFESVGDPVEVTDEVEVYCLSLHSEE